MDSTNLPIYELKDALLAALGGGRQVILEAPTGSGKSTQVPRILLDNGRLDSGQAIILQPRRLAARMLARRVAVECGVACGDLVGYQIRLDDASGPTTRIKFVTEGILLRQLLSDPHLNKVSTVIFDEFHERHLYTDISLARVVELQASARPDLNVVVMSATLNSQALTDYLPKAAVLGSAGRTYPVAVEHLERNPDPRREPLWEAARKAFEQAAATDNCRGHTLIFMPGVYEISRTVEAIRRSPLSKGFAVLPLHGELPAADQDAAVESTTDRKVVVATNVAETSLTIDGVDLVVDAGLARVASFDPHRGIETLMIEKISQAAADQRTGRAGRTRPGRCLRLWTERDHHARPAHEIPEIKRVDLAEAALALKAAGVSDLRTFPWFERPDALQLERAEAMLASLGAIAGEHGGVTPVGRRMLSFPLHPRYSRMLVAAEALHCVGDVALIAALAQGRGLFVRRPSRDQEERRDDVLGEENDSDFFRLMRAWRYAANHRFAREPCDAIGVHAAAARQAGAHFKQILGIAKRQLHVETDDRPVPREEIRRCLLLGFSDQLACRRDKGTRRCLLVRQRKGELAKDSVVREAPLFVAGAIHEIENRGREEMNVVLSLATAVEEGWLRELYPDEVEEGVEVRYDAAAKRVVSENRVIFRDLVLRSKVSLETPDDAAARILADRIVSGELKLPRWDEKVEQWVNRVNFLHAQCPELGLPPLHDDDRRTVVEQICLGKSTYREVRDRDVWPALRSWLTDAQQQLLDKHAPTRVDLPSGRAAKVRYPGDRPPQIAARIQELYGLVKPIVIGMGRTPLLIEILAPNQRPVQVTQDIAAFWRNTYPEVKRTLAKKYPKHEWR